jgi:hypothetical protein
MGRVGCKNILAGKNKKKTTLLKTAWFDSDGCRKEKIRMGSALVQDGILPLFSIGHSVQIEIRR